MSGLNGPHVNAPGSGSDDASYSGGVAKAAGIAANIISDDAVGDPDDIESESPESWCCGSRGASRGGCVAAAAPAFSVVAEPVGGWLANTAENGTNCGTCGSVVDVRRNMVTPLASVPA